MSGRASFNPGRRTDVREVNQPNAFMEVISDTFYGFYTCTMVLIWIN